MNSSDGLVLVIGGNGKIGKSFCLSALKMTNYKIINIHVNIDYDNFIFFLFFILILKEL